MSVQSWSGKSEGPFRISGGGEGGGQEGPVRISESKVVQRVSESPTRVLGSPRVQSGCAGVRVSCLRESVRSHRV